MPAVAKKIIPNQDTLKSEAVNPDVTQAPRPRPEKNLFAWKAPSRPFKRRNKDFWMTVMAIAGVFGLILFLVEGVMPVILIISVIFLFYVLSTVEPENIEYNITDRGVKIADKRTDMELLTRFWFTKRFNDELLVFETRMVPGRLELVINAKDKEVLRKTLLEYLSEEEVSPSGLDRAANWVSKKLPQ
ncbi:hypothetical protein KKB40_04045 [Patescibacteria group bacterium]|nr:hypothetical protein [Patescibacteria group bacterium]